MSLASIYKERARADQSAAADVNANVYHAWCNSVWHITHRRGGVIAPEPLLFNAKTNLSNARFDDETLAALFNIALCNEVQRTRLRLCELPCGLMTNRPDWSVLHIDGGILCDECAHNIGHQIEDYQHLPEAVKEQMQEVFMRVNPGWMMDAETGLAVPCDAR